MSLAESRRKNALEWYYKNKDRALSSNKEWRDKNKEYYLSRRRTDHLRYKYNITDEEYESIWEEQEGKCAVCGTPEKDLDRKLFIDHCHNTGAIRGLLCGKCNSGLGFFNDSVSLITKAAKYLEAYCYENKKE